MGVIERGKLSWAYLTFAIVSFGTMAHAGEPQEVLVVEDPLTSAEAVKGESTKTASGGQFSPAGWRALKLKEMLVIELADTATLGGALEIDISALDWHRANTEFGKFLTFFVSMFSNPKADHHVEHGGTNVDALWSLTGGASPGGSPKFGNTFAVFYASRGAKRCEPTDYEEAHTTPPAGWRWAPDKTYRFRVAWDPAEGKLTGHVDGHRFFDLPWKNQRSALRYIHIGRAEYQTFVGPVFSNLRVYKSVKAPKLLPPLVGLGQPFNGAFFTAPATIRIVPEVSPAGRAVQKVEFFATKMSGRDNPGTATKLGESRRPPYHFTWRAVPAGEYRLTATATNQGGVSASSNPKFLVVDSPGTAKF